MLDISIAFIISVDPLHQLPWPCMVFCLAVAEAVQPEFFDKEGVQPESEGVGPEY